MTALIGNVTSDPRLRFTAQGVAVADFNLAVTERDRREDGKWVDGETTYYRVSCWRTLAENVTETLTKGARVIVVSAREPALGKAWTGKDGVQRQDLEVTAEEVGPSLKWASAKIVKGERVKVEEPDPWAAPTADAWATTDAPPF